MRRLCTIASLAVLGLCAPSASAQGMDRCEADAEWEITYVFHTTFYADVTVDAASATGTGCDRLLPTGTERFNLGGIVFSGTPIIHFTGTTASRTDDEQGHVTITEDALHAVVASASAGTMTVHTGDGKCGEECWATRATWSAAAE